jgi:hypothetical protein
MGQRDNGSSREEMLRGWIETLAVGIDPTLGWDLYRPASHDHMWVPNDANKTWECDVEGCNEVHRSHPVTGEPTDLPEAIRIGGEDPLDVPHNDLSRG